MKARKILLVFLILYGGYVSAQEVRDSVKIYFRQGYSVLELSRRNNKEALDRIVDRLRTSYADSVYQLKRIQVVGGASPEGSIPLNKRLSVKRANVLFTYLSRYGELPDSLKMNVFLGRDWNGLIRLVSDDRTLFSLHLSFLNVLSRLCSIIFKFRVFYDCPDSVPGAFL